MAPRKTQDEADKILDGFIAVRIFVLFSISLARLTLGCSEIQTRGIRLTVNGARQSRKYVARQTKGPIVSL